jgi:hypothetical protein
VHVADDNDLGCGPADLVNDWLRSSMAARGGFPAGGAASSSSGSALPAATPQSAHDLGQLDEVAERVSEEGELAADGGQYPGLGHDRDAVVAELCYRVVDEIYKTELGHDILAEPTLLFASNEGDGATSG